MGDTCGLKHADKIVEADGQTRPKDIVTKLKEGKKVDVKVCRPPEMEIFLVKEQSQKLGAVIAQSGGVSLLVKEVKAGVFQNYNLAFPELAVCSGDRIVEVNGIRGNSERILNEIVTCSTIKA